MLRFGIIGVLALGLAACGQGGPNVQGKWAWRDAANCEADTDVFEFTGGMFQHYRNGEVRTGETGGNLSIDRVTEGDTSRVTTAFVTVEGGVTVSFTFEMLDENTMSLAGWTVNGNVPPAAQNAMGTQLFRCN